MTRIETLWAGDALAALTIHGHSGYADAGEDLVCAAVSAIAQTAVLGIKAYLPASYIQVDEKKALISIELSDTENAQAQAVLRTALMGLEDIAQGMPNYVKVIHRNRRWKA